MKARMKKHALKLYKEVARHLLAKEIKLIRTSSSSNFKPSSSGSKKVHKLKWFNSRTISHAKILLRTTELIAYKTRQNRMFPFLVTRICKILRLLTHRLYQQKKGQSGPYSETFKTLLSWIIESPPTKKQETDCLKISFSSSLTMRVNAT
jgi:hypothetical protein